MMKYTISHEHLERIILRIFSLIKYNFQFSIQIFIYSFYFFKKSFLYHKALLNNRCDSLEIEHFINVKPISLSFKLLINMQFS